MTEHPEPRRVTVMGLGRFGGGLGAARWFTRRGATVTVTDLAPPEALAESVRALEGLDIRFVLGEHREEDFSRAGLVVVNPAVRPDSPYLKVAQAAGARLTTEINLVLERAAGTVLGVTGTAGKSTTTEMLGAMLRAHDARTRVGGNLGGSLLDEDEALEAGAPVVLELSSFQLERLPWCGCSPPVALATNLAPNHLDWHGSAERYFEAKRNIVRFQRAADLAILNAADARLAGWKTPGRLARFSIEARPDPPCAWLENGAALCDMGGGTEELFRSASLHLPGRHNLANALAAALAARAAGVPAEKIAAAVDTVTPLEHRLEVVGTVAGVTYVNDSKATTPESAALGIEAYANRPVTLIAGGYDKGAPFGEFARLAAHACRHVLLVGVTAGKLAGLMRKAGGGAEIEEAGDLARAVRRAHEIAAGGGVVLLSPGCASYDQFPNYEARGETFRALVRALGADGTGM